MSAQDELNKRVVQFIEGQLEINQVTGALIENLERRATNLEKRIGIISPVIEATK